MKNQHLKAMGNQSSDGYRGERGAARLNFAIAMIIVASIFFVGYKYVPVAYQAYQFKDAMQIKVDAAATQGFDPAWVRDQLVKSEPEFDIPANAIITPSASEGRIEVRVQYTNPIEFPGYTYNYEFDYTAKSSIFLSTK
jgi:hypothetical protein